MSDLVLRNANIWAADGTRANAAVVRDGRFVFAGDERDMNAPVGAEVLDVGGRFVMPGFTDAHVHLLWIGFAATAVDLKGVTSVGEAVRRVAERAGATPPGAWITGAGWDQNLWADAAFPSRRDLDGAAPAHPVMLTHTSGHCAWVNTAALQVAGLTASTRAPVGGSIDIGDDGEPTGILRDNASRLVSEAMPAPSRDDRLRAMRVAIDHAHSLGVTTVHAMNVNRGEFQTLHALHDRGELDLRVRMYLSHERLDEWIERNLATGDGDDMLGIGGVKFFADGALGSLTAWMFEPCEEAGGTGFPLQPVEELEANVRRALVQGLAPAIHAIGDRANHETLSVFERLAGIRPELPRRIEHAQLLRRDDVPRFTALGITASMQPIHATQDWRKVDREWGQRGELAYAFATLAGAGTNIAFGSDAPVETIDPIAGLHAAVSRQTADGEPSGGWWPAERIAAEEALRHYTSGCARAAGEEASAGRIAAGMHADFVALSADPVTARDPAELLDLRVELAAIGGAIVYDARTR